MKETIKIEGMTCGGCVNGVRHALSHLQLIAAEVEIGQAKVEFDGTKVTLHQIIGAINHAGYKVVETEQTTAV